MAKLIAFFSRADENYFGGSYRYIKVGNTEKAARMIAEATGGDLFKIEQAVPYVADYQTCIAQAKADLHGQIRPAMVSMPANLDEYDEIFLGYPNYWGMRRWLSTHSSNITTGKAKPFIRSARMKAAV